MLAGLLTVPYDEVVFMQDLLKPLKFNRLQGGLRNLEWGRYNNHDLLLSTIILILF